MLALLLLLGGIAPFQLVQAVLILAATALAAGSLGTLVALWRERTFPALALTVLFLILYLCLTANLPAFVAVLVPALVGLAAWGYLGVRERPRSALLAGVVVLVALQPRKATAGTFRRPDAKPTIGLAQALAARIEHR